jgi:hypothetical protein
MVDRAPQFLLPEEGIEAEPHASRRRMVTLAVAATVTLGGLATALVLGTLGYDVRRSNMHERRLKGILVQSPTVYQVTEGLKEKAPLVGIVRTPEDLEESVAQWGTAKAAEIRTKAREWPQLRIYSAGDMIYFIFFDEKGIMRDYVYVSL